MQVQVNAMSMHFKEVMLAMGILGDFNVQALMGMGPVESWASRKCIGVFLSRCFLLEAHMLGADMDPG